MTQPQQPRLPLPPPLMTSDPSPFIQHTLNNRWTTIAHRVATENEFSSAIVSNLEALIQDLQQGTVRPLQPDGGADLAAWAGYVKPYLGQSWRGLPWYFAEAYFYRRILAATQYFTPGATQGIDPFARQKQTGLARAIAEVQAVAASFNAYRQWLTRQTAAPGLTSRSHLVDLMQHSLWGNQADLSLRPALAAAPVTAVWQREQSRILVDDTAVVVDRLLCRTCRRIDLIADNAGIELVNDLALADLLLTFDLAHTVTLHLKSHPTFVSDATVPDLHQTIETLAIDSSASSRRLATQLRRHLEVDRLQLHAHSFWTSPLVFWQMPPDLHRELAQADLIVIKGDANYRRLLGDRHWLPTTAVADIACYFPTALVAFRILKSEIIAGLKPNQAALLAQQDSDWLTNGQWGVIQFVDPAID
jgi:uncharacterized protein with ATP-grasp and redox domains